MSQIAPFPPSTEKPHAEKHAAFLPTPPRVALEIIETNQKAVKAFAKKRVAAWRSFSPQKKRFLAVCGVSVLLSVIMSGLATIVARQLGRTRTPSTTH